MPKDAFILFNERETAVEPIVRRLGTQDLSTHFWRRDIPFGSDWDPIEERQLKEARSVLVFLGEKGWGPNHLEITKNAQKLGKFIVPILIGNPPESAFEEADSLFSDRRYVDLQVPTDDKLQELVRTIRRREHAKKDSFDNIIKILIDGNEEQRSQELRAIQQSTRINKKDLAARLRSEINSYSPSRESESSTPRDPKKMASIRSWLLSTLIWCDAEGSREVIQGHTQFSFEPDANVRFWTLAGLYHVKASYLLEAAKLAGADVEPAVHLLARALISSASSSVDTSLISEFASGLASTNSEDAKPVLRVLRIVPFPELAIVVCKIIDRPYKEDSLRYDALYALSNSDMAQAASKVHFQYVGVDGLIGEVVDVVTEENRYAARNFTTLLAALDRAQVERALELVRRDSARSARAGILLKYLNEIHWSKGAKVSRMAGFASDTIDVARDMLDIKEDVQTLSAVMLADEVKPPLAIGLFGEWGTGKSFFMKSMQAEAERLSKKKSGPGTPKFCSNIVQIEFNAWHYADTNLWASLVSYLLEKLAQHVNPEATPEQNETALLLQLGSAKAIINEAEAEKQNALKKINARGRSLRRFQIQRQQKELELSNLRAKDLPQLLLVDVALQKSVQEGLEQIGAPQLLQQGLDLKSVLLEAHTLRGRVTATFLAMLNHKNRVRYLVFVILALIGGPVLGYLFQKWLKDGWFAYISALSAEVAAILSAAASLMRKGASQVNSGLAKLEEAKRKVDEKIAEKLINPSRREWKLQKEIEDLRSKEQAAGLRAASEAARVVTLEEQIRSIKEGRSLARYLIERTKSDDYRKHLGLISIIRQDFESLATRLPAGGDSPDGKIKKVDRIILYIDDLDRCPSDKVMEVLQAVHLLLAYPLFVVVVGVDPRWLLHSLGSTYSAFQGRKPGPDNDSDAWLTTPQNYLEKIFQIPFKLRGMTEPGFKKLMAGLLASESAPVPTPDSKVGEKIDSIKNDPSPSGPTPTGDPAPNPNPTLNVDIAGAATNPKVIPQSEPFDANISTEAHESVVNEESLTIKAWETEFAESLFQLIPSPRAAKRFSNVYRILKAPVSLERLSQFEGSAGTLGEFQVPMLLLAILIGAPNEAVVLFPRLYRRALSDNPIVECLLKFETLELSSPGFKALEDKIYPIVSSVHFPSSPQLFQDWLPRVSRFSFEVGQAVKI